jgi:2-polyprenyl-3-methyl-5-hydroxy-6-metoxy-1,4-benzoquinol methylase
MKDDQNIVKDYWQRRYEKKFSIGSSGHVSFNERYNSFVYRAYERALRKALARYGTPEGKRVMDVGSGTGYWVEYYRRAGAAEISGMDLTDISVEKLQKRYPGYRFEVSDIGSPSFRPDGTFDIVSCMDVLYYITDEEAFARALVNLAACMKPDGVLLITDTFHQARPKNPPYYYLHRDHTAYTRAMEAARLVRDTVIPVNYLLKKPIPFPALYSFVKWQLSKVHFDLEGIIGGLLYTADPLFMNGSRADILLMTAHLRRGDTRGVDR